MKKILIKSAAIMLVLIFLAPFRAVSAAVKSTLDKAVSDTAAYVYKTVPKPAVDSIGGEWAVLGLARSGCEVPDSYYNDYYKAVEKYVKSKKGVLHEKKYTEYSRVILGLTAAGYDPRNIGGYDLTLPLGDFEKTIWQGINGPIFALIALDSMGYPIPENKSAKTQATRELYIEEILRRQIGDGGWNLTAGANGKVRQDEKGDPDITGMALQALAKYQNKKEVKTATDKALDFLSKNQDKSGGYTSWGSVNAESASQVLIALCELSIDITDKRFIKNGKTLVDNILSFQNPDGSFDHTANGSGNSQMSTEQALYALVAACRISDEKNSLYRMDDTKKRVTFAPTEEIEIKRNPDVKKVDVTSPGKTFTDIKDHKNKKAIEALASRGIIAGKTNTSFKPGETMTRSDFAAVVIRSLGLKEKTLKPNIFTDVPAKEWYAGFVGSAYEYGIITDNSDKKFNPDIAVTRQDTAVMIAKAAKLCGLDTKLSATEIRDILAQFGDYTKSADWARESLAFCYKEGILDERVLNIKPAEAITKSETAGMIYQLLIIAELI